jgi:hypothetical protein
MQSKAIKSLIAGTILLTSSFACAGIIDTNNDSFIDVTTGIEWMDFGINNNHSYNHVASQLATDGEYDGWQIANKEQVFEMWSSAFLGLGAHESIENNTSKFSDGRTVIGSLLRQTFEIMGHNAILNESTDNERIIGNALYNGTDGLSFINTAAYTGAMIDLTNDDVAFAHDNINVTYLADFQSDEWSTMLIRSVDVPEPSILAMFALGLIGLRRRKNT